MKKQFYLATFFSALLLFSSCEDVVQVELDNGATLYVVDAFLNNKPETQTIVLTTSDNYFSNQAAPIVPNASVTLTDVTGNKVYNFQYSSNGKYTYDAASLGAIDGENHVFELSVIINGVNYTSMGTQKRTAVIDSISSVYTEDPGFGAEPVYNCFLWARDKVDQVADYYWIKTYRNDTLFAEPGDLNMAIDGTNGEVFDPNADTLDFTPPSIFLGFASFQKNDVCRVEVHSISRECYNFLTQAVTQIQNGGLFATTPENVKTNIVTPSSAGIKAIGWFNIAKVETEVKLVQ